MRRSQRILNLRSLKKCVGSEFTARVQRCNVLENGTSVGSSQLQKQANADSSSGHGHNAHYMQSVDILAECDTQTFSEQLPPYQINSNSDALMHSCNHQKQSQKTVCKRRKTSNSRANEQAIPANCKNTAAPAVRCRSSKALANTKRTVSQIGISVQQKAVEVMAKCNTKPPHTIAEATKLESTDCEMKTVNRSSKYATSQSQDNVYKLTKPKRVRKKVINKKNHEMSTNLQYSKTALNLTAPLRLADFRNMLKFQEMEGSGPHFDNAVDPRLMSLNSTKNSLLPKIYPPHFVNQLSPKTVDNAKSPNKGIGYLTPDLTQPYVVVPTRSSSTTSLPESLREFFEADDIHEIFNVDKTLYHLNVHHIQALAIVLNVRLEYLVNVIENILNLDRHLLKMIDTAFHVTSTMTNVIPNVTKREEKYLVGKAPHSVASPNGSSTVSCSPSPVTLRHFPSQRLPKF